MEPPTLKLGRIEKPTDGRLQATHQRVEVARERGEKWQDQRGQWRV